MLGSSAAILTLGLGAKAVGDPNHIVTLGFGTGAAPVVIPPPVVVTGGAGGLITFRAWREPTRAEVEKVRLELRLRKEKAKLEKIEKKIVAQEKKAAKVSRPDGILANIDSLTVRASELRKDIEQTTVDLWAVYDFLGLNFDDDDEDIEVLLLGL